MLHTILLAFLWGCGEPIEHHIAQLIEGGAGAEEAKMELNLAKRTAISPLIAAFQNLAHPPRARADIAQALYRLYRREANPRILTALIAALEDADPTVRTAVVTALGDLRKKAESGMVATPRRPG